MEPLYASVEEAYLAALDHEIEIASNAVLNGGLTPQKYDWFTGQLCGLKIAKREFTELMDRFKNQ